MEERSLKTVPAGGTQSRDFVNSVVNLYRPQTKLLEGNVFTEVCLSHSVRAGVGVGKPHTSWDRLHGRANRPPSLTHSWTYQPPTPPLDILRSGHTHPTPLLVTSGGHCWRTVQACSLEAIPLPLPPVLTSKLADRTG